MEEKDNCEKEKKKKWKASTSRQHMQNIFCVDSDVGVVAAEAPGGGSDGIPEEEEDLEMYMSDKDLCIRCNEGGRLFVCRDSGCPIAVHKEYMPDPLSIAMGQPESRQTNNRPPLLHLERQMKQMLKAPEGGVSCPIVFGETNSERIAKQPNATDVLAGQLENDANKIVDEKNF